MSSERVTFLSKTAESILENRRGQAAAEKLQKYLQGEGAHSYIIGNERGEANLSSVVHSGAYQPGERVLTIVDWDGPMGSPMRTVAQYLADLKADKTVWRGVLPALAELKDKGRVGFDNLFALVKMAELSALTVVATSRFCLKPGFSRWLPDSLNQILATLGDKIDAFPLMSPESITKLEKLGRGKLQVRTNKPLLADPGLIFDNYFFDQSGQPRYDRLILVISSNKDRKAVRRFLFRRPGIANRLVCFDTAGWFL